MFKYIFGLLLFGCCFCCSYAREITTKNVSSIPSIATSSQLRKAMTNTSAAKTLLARPSIAKHAIGTSTTKSNNVSVKKISNKKTNAKTVKQNGESAASKSDFMMEIEAREDLEWNIQETELGFVAEQVDDPHEKFNRAMYNFNDKLDTYLLKPVATIYKKVLPVFVTDRVTEFFVNVGVGSSVVNDLLQGNFYQSTVDTWRFAINSTIGIAGLFDVASEIGLPKNEEDFGLTLARWGYTNSAYLVIPFWGPSTWRDAFAIPVNIYTSYYVYVTDVWLRNSLTVLKFIDIRAQLLNFQKTYEEMSLDPYVLTRSAYMQRRNYQMERNRDKLDIPYSPKEMIRKPIYNYLHQ